MMGSPPPPSDADIYTSGGIAVLAVLGGLSKSTEWHDSMTGKFSPALMIGGLATALIMATVVRAGGVHYGVEPWIQVAGAGVLCYVGPDPILRAIANLALKRFGLPADGGPK